jgi:hypothetical protein
MRGTSLILAIPRGIAADCVAIQLELCKQAMLYKESAFYCEAVDQLFLESQLLLLPCMDAYTIDDEGDMSKVERIMRHGYARDRVMACNRVKQALLNQGKVGATEEYINKQKVYLQYIKLWFNQAETTLAGQEDIAKPSDVLMTKHSQWAKLLDTDSDALHNQVSLLQATAIHGTTKAEIDALAIDPTMQNGQTFQVSLEELSGVNTQRRERLIGTETFVAFTFPPTQHSLLVAAAATEGGLPKTAQTHCFPAHVTFHSPTGEVNSLAALCPGQQDASNSLFVGDAAELLAKLHSLSREADRACVLLEHGAS